MVAHYPYFPLFLVFSFVHFFTDGCMKTIPVEDITAVTTTVAPMCPSLTSLNTPSFSSPGGTSPKPYSVQPDVGCTSVGCTNTVTCSCLPAGDCYLTLGNNLDTASPDTSPYTDMVTNVPVTSPTITCTPSGTYSVAAGPAGTGGPFTQISCNA